jgi:hypothetical protein
MTFSPPFSQGNYVPENISLPEDPKQFKMVLKQVLEDHARLINRKDTGQYEDILVQNNQTYFTADPQQKAYIYRVVIPLGTLSTGANAIAHNIPVVKGFIFTRIYGVIYNSTALIYVPIPNNGILMTVDATNVNVNIPVTYNHYVGNAVLEFSQG